MQEERETLTRFSIKDDPVGSGSFCIGMELLPCSSELGAVLSVKGF